MIGLCLDMIGRLDIGWKGSSAPREVVKIQIMSFASHFSLSIVSSIDQGRHVANLPHVKVKDWDKAYT